MTIRARLTLWYAAVLSLSLVLIGGGAFREIDEQLRHQHRARSEERALSETGELVFQVGLPAVALGLAGGWWLTRRALAPLAALTEAAEKIDARTLDARLPRTGSGDELDRLTEVLNRMTARLNDSFSGIRDFTLHASHELKTPLTVLCGELETILRDASITAEERERCGSQLDELRRMSRIVDGLTLLAKADAGLVTLPMAPLRLDELVKDSFADAQLLAQVSGLSVALTRCEPLTVSGDAHRLRQLLLNLADNAVKYNQQGGSVAMTLLRTGDSAEFSIANTGPGIPPESLPRVFDRFYRGDPAHSNGTDGCGLGLSIARWIVMAHQGTIRVESVPGRLTTVRVALPLVGRVVS